MRAFETVMSIYEAESLISGIAIRMGGFGCPIPQIKSNPPKTNFCT